MSRYIDTKWLEDNAKEYSLGYYESDEWATPLSALDEAPSIDLVRCADCRHCTLGIVVERRVDGYEKTVNLCRHTKHTEEWSVPRDWYCADGERRE